MQHFDLLATAPEGVRRLRELILALAVKGKLVAQNPNDEPAVHLVARLQAESEAASSRRRRTAPPGHVTLQEGATALPSSWRRAHLASIAVKLTDGSHNPPKDAGAGVPMLSSQNIREDGAIDFSSPSRYVSLADFERENSRTDVRGGDVLLTIVASLGRSAVVPDNASAFALQRSVAVIRTGLIPSYLAIFLRSPVARAYYDKHGKGTAQRGIYLGKLGDLPVPVPPKAEQSRIVARVDELMRLCDALETKSRIEAEGHARLLATLLGSVTGSATPNEDSGNWQCVADYFDLLLDRTEAVDALEKCILQLAVRGALVKQDPNEQTAGALLQHIRNTRQRRDRNRSSLRKKGFQAVAPDARPFELPQGWAWTRFSELGEFGRGKSKHRPRNDPALFFPPVYPLVQTGEVARASGIIREYHSKYSEAGLAQSRLWPAGTLCIAIAANIADAAILGFDACFPDSVVGFLPDDSLGCVEYFQGFMETAKDHLLEFAPATAQKNINLEILESLLIPLPPKQEMQRIVARVTELRQLCSDLRIRMAASRATQARIADSLVESAVDIDSASS